VRASTYRETARVFTVEILPLWKGRRLSEVTRVDIRKLDGPASFSFGGFFGGLGVRGWRVAAATVPEQRSRVEFDANTERLGRAGVEPVENYFPFDGSFPSNLEK
jgi:hypothetical protein